MTLVARLTGIVALVLTVVPAALFAAGQLAEPSMKSAMLVGTLLWFFAAPLWLRGAK